MNAPASELPVYELLNLARQAGLAILEVYRSDFAVEHKADDTPVTQADLAAHRCLLQGLTRLFPDIPVLSEESAETIQTTERRGWQRLWLVDPLDGTREFIHRRNEFTVNVALVESHRPIFGLVHLPVLDVSYWGIVGEAAYSAHGNTPAQAIRCARPAARPLRVLGSRSHPDPHLDGFLRKLPDYELHTAGSSLKFCRIAEGAADLYPRFAPTSEWDTAAGQAVVEAAGGAVIDMHGQDLQYNARDSLLNPWFLASGDPQQDWRAHLPPPVPDGTST